METFLNIATKISELALALWLVIIILMCLRYSSKGLLWTFWTLNLVNFLGRMVLLPPDATTILATMMGLGVTLIALLVYQFAGPKAERQFYE